MGTVAHTDHIMKLFVLAALVACASSRPRFLVIPLDDMQDLELMDVMQNFPMYRMPGLARQPRPCRLWSLHWRIRSLRMVHRPSSPSHCRALGWLRLSQAVSGCLGLSGLYSAYGRETVQ